MTRNYEKEVKEAESVLEDKKLTDSEISQELIDKDNPTENVKPSEIDFLRKKPDLATQIDFTLLGDCPRKLRKKQLLQLNKVKQKIL